MSFPRISSPITKVYWAGWESDTLRLQKAGWELSTEQDIYRQSIRMAFRNTGYNIYGISNPISREECLDMKSMFINGHPRSDLVFNYFPPLTINYMASRMHVELREHSMEFMPIDATPAFETREVKSIEDFQIFRPIGNPKELIVTPDSVPELLELIMKKQDPKQFEIREKKRKEWRKFTREINQAESISVEERIDPASSIVAQLITI